MNNHIHTTQNPKFTPCISFTCVTSLRKRNSREIQGSANFFCNRPDSKYFQL